VGGGAGAAACVSGRIPGTAGVAAARAAGPRRGRCCRRPTPPAPRAARAAAATVRAKDRGGDREPAAAAAPQPHKPWRQRRPRSRAHRHGARAGAAAVPAAAAAPPPHRGVHHGGALVLLLRAGPAFACGVGRGCCGSVQRRSWGGTRPPARPGACRAAARPLGPRPAGAGARRGAGQAREARAGGPGRSAALHAGPEGSLDPQPPPRLTRCAAAPPGTLGQIRGGLMGRVRASPLRGGHGTAFVWHAQTSARGLGACGPACANLGVRQAAASARPRPGPAHVRRRHFASPRDPHRPSHCLPRRNRIPAPPVRARAAPRPPGAMVVRTYEQVGAFGRPQGGRSRSWRPQRAQRAARAAARRAAARPPHAPPRPSFAPPSRPGASVHREGRPRQVHDQGGGRWAAAPPGSGRGPPAQQRACPRPPPPRPPTHLPKLNARTQTAAQGFVPNMRVPGTFYVNDALAPLLFEELAQAVARKEVGAGVGWGSRAGGSGAGAEAAARGVEGRGSGGAKRGQAPPRCRGSRLVVPASVTLPAAATLTHPRSPLETCPHARRSHHTHPPSTAASCRPSARSPTSRRCRASCG
jgi:hypothetical protein